MWLPDGTIRHLRVPLDLPGHAHELTFSCYRRLRLLSKDRSRQWFIDALELARGKHDFDLWAYVVMPEHVHVLLVPQRSQYRIADILKTIKQSVARRAIRFLRQDAPEWLDHLAVKRNDEIVGYRFWEAGGGYDRNVVTPEVALAAVDYIHNNPVRRGLATSPVEWPWSSASWYAGAKDVKLAMDSTLPWRDG